MPPLLQQGWLALWRCKIMRKAVRGALQGCSSKGLVASQQNPPAPNTATLFSSEHVSRGLGCVSSVCVCVWGGPKLPHFGLYNVFCTSTDHINGSHWFILPYTVTIGVPYLLSYIFTKFGLCIILHNPHSDIFVLFKLWWST